MLRAEDRRPIGTNDSNSNRSVANGFPEDYDDAMETYACPSRQLLELSPHNAKTLDDDLISVSGSHTKKF